MCRPKDRVCQLLWAALLAGCGYDMADQPRYDPLEPSTMFPNGMSSRPLVVGTVARGHLHTDTTFYQGKADGQLARQFPLAMVAQKLDLTGEEIELRRAILERGRARFEIFCAPCHGRTGDGQGMVVARGFPAPPAYNIPRLREAPIGHFYDVITNGFGRMLEYRDQVPPADRWAIAAYIRALQLSQHAPADWLSVEDRGKLDQ